MRSLRPVKLLRSIGAIAIGYALFVLGAQIAQEVILAGVSYQRSSHATMAAAAILTPLAAAIGGAVTAAIAPARPFLHLLPMFALITLETTYLYTTGRVDGPLWFEAMAGLSLIVGGALGAWLYVMFTRRRGGGGQGPASSVSG